MILEGAAAFCSFIGACLAHVSLAGGVEIENSRIELSDETLKASFSFQRPAGAMASEAAFVLKTEAGRELPLSFLPSAAAAGKAATGSSGKIELSIPASGLASGSYRLVLKSKLKSERDKNILGGDSWNAMIVLNGYSGKDVEIKAKIKASPGLWLFARGQNGLGFDTKQFNFYLMSLCANLNVAKSFVQRQTGAWATKRAYAPIPDYSVDAWHDCVFRCVGNKIEAEVDGAKALELVDEEGFYKSGSVGLRASYATWRVADLTVKDLESGETVFDLNSPSGADPSRWTTLQGEWSVSKGGMEEESVTVASFNVPKAAFSGKPQVSLAPKGGFPQLSIDGRPFAPLILCPGETELDPFRPATSKYMKEACDAGVKLFAPIVWLRYDERFQGPDLKALDEFMTQLLLACPDAYFIVRAYVTPPPNLPAAERTFVTRRPADGSDTPKTDSNDRDVGGVAKFDASLASKSYKAYASKALRDIIRHVRTERYGERLAGLLLAGAGYEGDWGHPNGNYGLWMDASQAQVEAFSSFLKAKYGSDAALRAAWLDESATLERPRLPGLEDRCVSDLAGFRAPGKPGRSMWVSDFLDMYCDQNSEVVKPLFDVIAKEDPGKFYGRFSSPMGTCNKAWGGIQVSSSYRTDLVDFSNPAMSFLVGCLSYGDRMAGGTSVYTTQAWESARRHGRIVLAEADIHTFKAPQGERSLEDTVATMRREFAHTVLIGKQALWFFDMAYSGPWFDDPALVDEMGRETKIAEAALKLESRGTAESLVVQDNRSLRYFATTPAPLEKGKDIAQPFAQYAYSQVHKNVEAMSRSGAQMDFILSSDFLSSPRYKLSIFPTQFLCDAAMRNEIRKRLEEDGGVFFFFTAAGLLDEGGASLEGMASLLGMKVSFDGPASLDAVSVQGEHPIARSLGAGVKLDEGNTRWHRFYVDDATAVPLARYADAKVAMAVKPFGKGFVVYSGMPVVSPAVYRAVARFAGAHVYSESDDSFFADSAFVSLHSRTQGLKRIALPEDRPSVVDVFSGQEIPCRDGSVSIEMPAKRSALLYVGDDKAFIARIRELAKTRD